MHGVCLRVQPLQQTGKARFLDTHLQQIALPSALRVLAGSASGHSVPAADSQGTITKHQSLAAALRASLFQLLPNFTSHCTPAHAARLAWGCEALGLLLTPQDLTALLTVCCSPAGSSADGTEGE